MHSTHLDGSEDTNDNTGNDAANGGMHSIAGQAFRDVQSTLPLHAQSLDLYHAEHLLFAGTTRSGQQNPAAIAGGLDVADRTKGGCNASQNHLICLRHTSETSIPGFCGISWEMTLLPFTQCHAERGR